MKYIHKLSILLLALVMVLPSCEEDDFEALQVAAPSEVGAVFNMANDNSGTISVAPTATGAVMFNIYFGDAADEEPTEVKPGAMVNHSYPEGDYTMRILAIGADGKTAEATQPITIRFDPPENLSADIAISNRSVTVTPSADGATLFEVYFGDIEEEEATIVMPGEAKEHVYEASGNYTIRVVAKGAGAATAEYEESIQVVDLLFFPLTFEQTDLTFGFAAFGGAGAEVIENPDASGINTSSRVVKFVKQPGAEVWGGVSLEMAEPIDFASFGKIKLKLWSPKEGITFLFKVENLENPDINYEVSGTSSTTNEWEELLFDFSDIDQTQEYQRMALFVDFGNSGDGTEFYFDSIELTNEGTVMLELPLGFESDVLEYTFDNFGGASSEVVANPDASGLNISSKVGQLVKSDGSEVWAGSFIALPEPLDFSGSTTFRLKVWSPKAGATVKLKVENADDGNIAYEADATTTVSGAWEELSYDFSGIDQSQSYHKVVVFFDFGNAGDGSTYYFDDIRLSDEAAVEPLVLPLTFEASSITYTFEGFGNASAEVIPNPDATGINTSTNVARLTKASGAETWAGVHITLDAPMDFATNKTFTVKTWSPKTGATVKLKVENVADGNIAYEADATTTVANGWEELTYDFSGIDVSQSYGKVVIFFDFGNGGDGTDYYFDDITLSN